ncbi:MAG: L-serine ammonia-lyase, iron-sulfur-dependent, subunit alpha, partial [Verrucomicrobia bacterium]|nr:L-serine ammonia-lyase, iron-sulfur-dependent, subunit alpha [Verrucomicrobiota bacterium]
MKFQFRTAVQLLEICQHHDISIAEATIRSEIENGSLSREEIEERMITYYQRMKEAVHAGLEITQRSRSGLSGGDSRRVLAHSEGASVSALGP